MRRLLPLLAVLCLAAGCGGSRHSSGTTTATTAGTAPAPRGNGCVAVPHSLLAKLESGLVLEGATLVHVRAYRSPDFPTYYFVSGRVPQLGGPKVNVVTFAVNGLQAPKEIAAVDTNARQISQFGPGKRHDPALTLFTRGAKESRACVTGS